MNLRDTLVSDGFAVATNAFSHADLDAVSRSTDDMIEAWQAGVTLQDPDYWSYLGQDDAPVLYRIHNLERKHESVLHLIEMSSFKDIVKSVVGSSATPTAFALTIKMPHEGAPIPWHRDPVEVPVSTTFNFSIYLDESTSENGCLEALRASHLFPSDYVVVKERPSDAVPIPANPGDVTIHDVRLVHGSGASTSPKRRRAIVIEFRPKELL